MPQSRESRGLKAQDRGSWVVGGSEGPTGLVPHLPLRGRRVASTYRLDRKGRPVPEETPGLRKTLPYTPVHSGVPGPARRDTGKTRGSYRSGE